ncbi:MAG: hypothetical protein R3B72_11310 [Polyangiaceae bacterium]
MGSPEEEAATELEYRPEGQRAGSTVEAVLPISSTLVVAALLGAVAPDYALPGAALVGLGWWWHRRQSKKLPHCTLRVRDGRLAVIDRLGRVLVDEALDDVLEVELDTKTVEKVTENPSGPAELRFINATVSPAVDTSRIQLVLADREYRLTDHYTSNIDATDWNRQIRRFLRRHGWTPADAD